MKLDRTSRLAVSSAILTALLAVIGVNWVSGKMGAPATASASQAGAEASSSPLIVPMGTAFTYQGEIQDGGSAANGSYDFSFRLLDGSDPSTAGQVGSTVDLASVPVEDGIFTVQLDFGASAFTGVARWLEISVGRAGDPLTTLAPTQPLTPAPYALYGEDADADPANETNTGINFTGTTLQITDAGGTLSQNIGTFNGNLVITTNGRLGVREPAPTTDLFITQSDGLIAGTGGASFARTTVWKIMHTGSHFSFVEDNVRRAYIETGTGSYVTTSDRAQKKDIAELGPVLDQVLKLDPVQFHYLRQSKDTALNIGFVAQDVAAIFPDLARTAEDGEKGLAYSDFGVLAIASIQEQQAQIEALKQENKELRAEIDAIKVMLEQQNGAGAASAAQPTYLAGMAPANLAEPGLAGLITANKSKLAFLVLVAMMSVWLGYRNRKVRSQ